MPTVTRPESSPRLVANVNLYEPGPSSAKAICNGRSAGLDTIRSRDPKNENPAEWRGSLEFSSCSRPGRASEQAVVSAAGLPSGPVAGPAAVPAFGPVAGPAAAGSYCLLACKSPKNY